ncbi:hypothetical protein KSP40_PGU007074 [Platanthera guangdongensis]|uniref:Uncharacterized protein n=1 Tax=Platanthera guangdongensis TaxID=2320717 RepID=A0ABR2M708_9ASPA
MARILLLSSGEGASHLPLPLLAGFFALIAITAIVSALCASHHRKSRRRSPSPSPARSTPEQRREKQQDNAVVLPASHGPIGPAELPGAVTPRRKLSMSLSLKIPEGLSRVRTGRREATEKERKSEATADDAVWMKAIILGEKCRVPDDEESMDEAAAAGRESTIRELRDRCRYPEQRPCISINDAGI